MLAMFGMVISFFVSAIWLAWNINNWANDFYLITSKRMVWVERVSGFYESRQEAPLGTLFLLALKPVKWGGRCLIFGCDRAHLYCDIRFERVAHAKTIGKLIESYWKEKQTR